jgi:hypothetical protein
MGSNIVHFEVNVDDVERAKKFYSTVFGWAFKYVEDMNYTLVYPSGEITDGPAKAGINGGMMKRSGKAPADDASSNAFVYWRWTTLTRPLPRRLRTAPDWNASR